MNESISDVFYVFYLTRETQFPVCRCHVMCSTQTGRSTTSARWSEWAKASWWTTATTAPTSTSTSAGASVSPDRSVTGWISNFRKLRLKRWVRIFLQIFSFEILFWVLVIVNHHLCSSDLPGKSCPEGSAACLVNSHGSFDMGFPTKQLELLSNDRYLHVPVEIGWNILKFPQIRFVFFSLC